MDILAKTQLLIIDDWLRNPLSEVQTQDLLEIIDDRYKHTYTALASQIPVGNWHERFASPTLSDAIMDRLVHNAYSLELNGESMRKQKSLTSFRLQGHIMNPQRRFTPTGGLFEQELMSGLARMRNPVYRLTRHSFASKDCSVGL